jgi:hypothetical protein
MGARATREAPRPRLRTTVERGCEDCRAQTAFQAWEGTELEPAFNFGIDFAEWQLIPPGKRAVIELVTAHIFVPEGEWARLRLYTSLGTVPSNLDLVVVPQSVVGGQQQFVATHSLRVYSDSLIAFNIGRDNDTTTGEAFVCISGYLDVWRRRGVHLTEPACQSRFRTVPRPAGRFYDFVHEPAAPAGPMSSELPPDWRPVVPAFPDELVADGIVLRTPVHEDVPILASATRDLGRSSTGRSRTASTVSKRWFESARAV